MHNTFKKRDRVVHKRRQEPFYFTNENCNNAYIEFYKVIIIRHIEVNHFTVGIRNRHCPI